jgi:glycosyltransferase involved in cell wall biosynthesis
VRVLIGNKFWYAKGGTEAYLVELLEELLDRGWDVIPFAMKHGRNFASPYSEFFVDEVDYHAPQSWYCKARAAARLLYSRHAAGRLGALVDAHPPDIAHLHNIYHQLSPAILPLLAQRGIPILMTLHDLKLACPNYKMRTHGRVCERCVGGGYHHAVVHRCVGGSVMSSALCAIELAMHRWSGLYENNVSRFIVPSRFYRQKMIEAGIPAAKLEWIPNFTRVDRYAPSYGSGAYFVYFGRLSEEKGLSTLVEAVRTFENATLLIIGDGPSRPALERATAGLRHVRVLGPRQGPELIDLVRGARFSVIPSEWYENCSMSCIESFACGTPVVGANIGGIPEMVEHGETGLLFEPSSVEDLREKIEDLFARPGDAARMGRAARAKAEREYSPRSHLDRLLALYHETLGARYRATA